MAIPEKITLSGKVYIKYIDDLKNCSIGDTLLLLNDDATCSYLGDYENLKFSGYLKLKIYDGLVWQNIDIGEFCQDKQNKFAKKQRALDSAMVCRTIIERQKGIIVRRTYRAHYTSNEYIQNDYIRKSNRHRTSIHKSKTQ